MANAKQSDSKQLLILVAAMLAVVAGVVFYLMGLMSHLREASSLVGDIETKRGYLDSYQSKLEEYQKTRALHALYAEYAKGYTEERHENAELMNRFSALAEEMAIEIIEMKPKPMVRKDEWSKAIIDITLISTIQELTQFIYELEDKDKLMKVESMVINTDAELKSKILSEIRVTKKRIEKFLVSK